MSGLGSEAAALLSGHTGLLRFQQNPAHMGLNAAARTPFTSHQWSVQQGDGGMWDRDKRTLRVREGLASSLCGFLQQL